MAIVFEWDPQKDNGNRRKHGVSFAEACTVFEDGLAQIFPDPDHSDEEVREIIIGHSITGGLLIVSFTERKLDRVRIISARVATKTEKRDYEEV